MNRKIALTFVFASIAAGSVLAETPMANPPTIFKATLSRAEVQAALHEHRRSGAMNTWDDGYNQLADFRSTMTRAQVRAEFMGARDEVAAMNGEDSGARYIARVELPRTYGRQLAALPAGE